MQDRLSMMLDNMIFVVDNGHSFDGIVSVPAIGLADFGYRPGILGWVEDTVEHFWATAAAIVSFFSRTPAPSREVPVIGDDGRATDIGIGFPCGRSRPTDQLPHLGGQTSSQRDAGDSKVQLASDAKVPGIVDSGALGGERGKVIEAGPLKVPSSTQEISLRTGNKEASGDGLKQL